MILIFSRTEALSALRSIGKVYLFKYGLILFKNNFRGLHSDWPHIFFNVQMIKYMLRYGALIEKRETRFFLDSLLL